MSGRDLEVIALTPEKLINPAIAIAASRAGAIGVLNLSSSPDLHASRQAIEALVRDGRGRWGVRLDSSLATLNPDLIDAVPASCFLVILAAPAVASDLPPLLAAFRPRCRTIMLEVTSLAAARAGEAAGVDGLIAKGNEAGGWVGEETSFIILQGLVGRCAGPVWVQGGVGLHTAAACHVGGAAGVVLDTQLALARESPLPEYVRSAIARMDGSETTYVGSELGLPFRTYARPGAAAVEALRLRARELVTACHPPADLTRIWHNAVQERVGWGDLAQHAWPVGQDAAFARELAEQFVTVGGIIEGMRAAVTAHVRAGRALNPLGEGSALARAHGTRYPIIQGPMTRVSDVAAFAATVAEEGALPFLALALLRGPEVRALLQETQRVLGDHAWGIGILGFVPPDLRQEQLEVAHAFGPRYALIAGGRPDQALALEERGTATYLHVPSPALLTLFLESGARRFVFEGRECGGHVGPRSSFVLWNTMIDTLLSTLPAADLALCDVVFAGGIHDAASAGMVAAMAAPLVERGARIGVLLGSAYLFTNDAVECGAITRGFQEEAIRCEHTVLVETGPGHAIRCAETPYIQTFAQERARLEREGLSPEEVRVSLEALNIGRLRIASKGLTHHSNHGHNLETPTLTVVHPSEQRAHGMYMLGQLTALRRTTCSVADLHRDVSVGSTAHLAALKEAPHAYAAPPPRREPPADVAIIGMAALLPKAPELRIFWENIINRVDAITEIPSDRWDWRRYFDPDPDAPDKVYSRWGGFLDDVPFDPIRYGMPPTSIRSIEPLQLLTLEVVRAALADAGYERRPFPRQQTAVIIGAGGGVADLGSRYALRSALPSFLNDVPPELLNVLPEWTEDSFAGILLNVAAGRVANRFDLGGVNYTVDAACASSLAAVYLAVRELETGTSDMAIVGGVDTVQNPFGYLCFSKTHALSPRGRCRTFDDSADGIAISEGLAMLVLKRLRDAERDGDRIYAVIKGAAGSSDGRDKGLTAPRPEGQALALERAYAKAGYSPSTVELIEAHGTGTVAGDRAEVETLKRVFDAAGAPRERCALGSVKSMIGHTKCAAGVAGLVKVALALHEKVLPPTLHVERPNARAGFPESPFFVNTEARPWVHAATEPRRAGVSAFGFGGTNFHIAVEEYTGAYRGTDSETALRLWPSELLIFTGATRAELLAAIERVARPLANEARPAMRDLAYTLWRAASERVAVDGCTLTLAVVATSLDDARTKLETARAALAAEGPLDLHDPRGIYVTDTPVGREGCVAALFPGQGSQQVGMMRDLALHFPVVRERLESADRALCSCFDRPLSAYVFPPPPFSEAEERRRQTELTRTDVAQPAIGAADLGSLALLHLMGVRPEMVAGHSYGEYVALCAAGVITEDVLYRVSEARGRAIIDAAGGEAGAMLAIAASPDDVVALLAGARDVWIANRNAPRQTIVSGTRQALEDAGRLLEERGVRSRMVPVACAFHSPLVAAARDRLAAHLADVPMREPDRRVYSNTLGSLYPSDPAAIREVLADHLVRPVEFLREIEAMYQDGARVFIEVGPRTVLTTLVGEILSGRPHLAVALVGDTGGGVTALQHALARLAAHGLPLSLAALFERRTPRLLDLEGLTEQTRDVPLPSTTWLVNGSRARPLGAPPELPPPISLRLSPPAPAGSGGPTNGEPGDPSRPLSRVEAPAVGPVDDAVLGFQQLMQRFLATQQEVMLAYLGRGSTSSASSPDMPPTPQAPAADTLPLGTAAIEPPGREPSMPATSEDAPAPPAVPAGVSEDLPDIQLMLLRIVAERTGYPDSMLRLDLDLEAELGIDSIKRVEILGVLERGLPAGQREAMRGAIERLTGIKTLGGIVTALASILDGGEERPYVIGATCSVATDHLAAPGVDIGDSAPLGNPGPPSIAAPTEELARFLPARVELRLPSGPPRPPADGAFLITDDARGVGFALATALRASGAQVVVAGDVVGADAQSAERVVDFTDGTALEALVGAVRRTHGRVAGLVHLLPLGNPSDDTDHADAWQTRLAREATSLFRLVRSAAGDFAGRADVRILAAFPVALPSVGAARPCFAGHAALTGMIKTLAQEWPNASCRTVGLVTGSPPAILAAHLLAELWADDDEVEVSYDDSHRFAARVIAAPLASDPRDAMELDSSSVMLVTGGARGITAEVACELAERFRPTLVLTGRSPLPGAEPADTTGVTDVAALKHALAERLRQVGAPVTPTRVETDYRQLCNERAMRSALEAMTRAGAKVRYHQLDVRDRAALARLVTEIRRVYGRLDGVIHGAG